MGRYLQNTNQQHNSTSADFVAVERRAFNHVGEHLRAMPYASRADLRQAAFSYLVRYMAAQGFPVREEWARAKAAKWAAWWARKHRDQRRPRPHTQYSEAQAKRGRAVSYYRRSAQADVAALVVQIAADRGSQTAELAALVGQTARNVRRLKGRKFSALLVWIIGRTFGNCSAGFLSKSNAGRNQKETLPSVRLGQNAAGVVGDVAADVAGLSSQREKPGDFAEIVGELGALYPHRRAELAALLS